MANNMVNITRFGMAIWFVYKFILIFVKKKPAFRGWRAISGFGYKLFYTNLIYANKYPPDLVGSVIFN